MGGRASVQGELVISQWEHRVNEIKGTLVLTNLRVWIEKEASGSYEMVSLMLDEVQWAGIVRVHKPWLLALAALSLVVTLVVAARTDEVKAVIAAGLTSILVLISVYFSTRSVQLQIGSGAGLIATRVPGGAHTQAQEFVSKVEQHAVTARSRP